MSDIVFFILMLLLAVRLVIIIGCRCLSSTAPIAINMLPPGVASPPDAVPPATTPARSTITRRRHSYADISLLFSLMPAFEHVYHY
jgi:hypothetical protein